MIGVQSLRFLDRSSQNLMSLCPILLLMLMVQDGDDVIGALAEYSQESDLTDHPMFAEPQPLLIISADHDFQQLQKWSNVKQWSPIRKKFVTLTENPQQVLMEHIISGDKGDGVSYSQ